MKTIKNRTRYVDQKNNRYINSDYQEIKRKISEQI